MITQNTHTLRERARTLVRATTGITIVASIFAIVTIVAWEQVDDAVEAKLDKWTTKTYVYSSAIEVPNVVDEETKRKEAIFVENIHIYWEDTTQKYLQEQLEVINKKMEEVKPMNEETFDTLKEAIRRTEVSL